MARSTAALTTAAPRSYGPRVFMEQGGDSLRGTSSGRILMGNTSSGFIKVTANAEFNDSTSATYTVAGNVTLTSDADMRQQHIVSQASGKSMAARSQVISLVSTKVAALPTPAAGLRVDVVCIPTTGKCVQIKTGSTKIFINSSNGKDMVVKVTNSTANQTNFGLHIPFFGVDATHWIAGIRNARSDTGLKAGMGITLSNGT